MSNDTVTIFIPAYNEENNIQQSLRSVSRIASQMLSSYEIVIVDDGSTDNTKAIVIKEQSINPHIRLISHVKNTGLGTCFQDAISEASGYFFCGYPGDGDISPESFKNLLSKRKHDVVILQYISNQQDRTIIRRTISRFYTRLMNVLFGLHIHYFNGYCIAPTEMFRQIRLISSGHTIFSEIAIRLIKKGYKYTQIPFTHIHDPQNNSHAGSFSNIYRVMTSLLKMWIDIQILGHA